MRIAVVGAGAIGSYVGGRLLQAGCDVVFIARGAQLRALATSGLTIVEPDGRQSIPNIVATDDSESIGAVDMVLLCVKLFDSRAALRANEPLFGPRTFVLSLQNGVESVATATALLGPGRAIGAAVYVVAKLVEPGMVERTGTWSRIEIAEPGGETTDRVDRVAAAFRAAGIDCEIRADLEQMLWSKFVLLAATSAMTAVTRQPIGYVRGDPVALAAAIACMDEALAVARARGVALPPDTGAVALRQLRVEMEASSKASQLTDLELGRALELEYLSGAIHRFGRELGVPTPVHSTVYAALRPFEQGSPASR